MKNLCVCGNDKIGRGINHISIAAGVSCPCKSEVCGSVCVGKNGYYHMTNVIDNVWQKYELSKTPGFVARAVKEIRRRRKKVEVLRMHAVGDYYSPGYIKKWIKLVQLFPEVVFYGYTRSWRSPKLLPGLVILSQLPNVKLWWSTDFATDAINGRPPVVLGVKVCYLQSFKNESIPAYSNLVFRVKPLRKIKAKYIDGVLVCPCENGTKYPEAFGKMDCTKCRLCFRDKPMPRKVA